MQIFVDDNHRIIQIGGEKEGASAIEIDGRIFEGKCEAYILAHNCEVQYMLDVDSETGIVKTDKSGAYQYALDESGQKIPCGYSIYPSVSLAELELIQTAYELRKELNEKGKLIAAQDENITALQMALVEIYEGGGET